MKFISNPTRMVALAFLLIILVGTFILSLPISQAEGHSAPLLVAFFTAVSAVSVTGLVVVDTGTYWSTFGQTIIMLLFQIGGFGIMTAATLFGLIVNSSIRLRTRVITQVETRSVGLGDVSSVVKLVLLVTLLVELAVAIVLTCRFHYAYGEPWGKAAWSGLFHAVSAFNNAGFSIYADSLMSFSADVVILLPVMLAIIIGGIGFPVLNDLWLKKRKKAHLSLHTKLTLLGTFFLLVVGFFGILAFEWSNPGTLAHKPLAEKVLDAAFSAVSVRTAGFNAVDIGAMTHQSWLLHYLLMFIGGGSGGTAGGVKVGTVAILVLIVIAEIHGHKDTTAFERTIKVSTQRKTITVLAIAGMLVTFASLVILSTTDLPTDQVIFEVISAFGTVGLSTGITADLPPISQLVLTLLMYSGRIGLITFAVSLLLSEERMLYRYPEEEPIVG